MPKQGHTLIKDMDHLLLYRAVMLVMISFCFKIIREDFEFEIEVIY